MEGKRGGAVFLDRDGTINEEVGYLDRLEKLRLIPGAAEAIRLINESGMKAIVVTNQSGIARGLFDEAFVETVHRHLEEMLRREGAFLDGLYFCPHHPTEGQGRYLCRCTCRKPAPGLLIEAEEEFSVAPERSYMIGDTAQDIQAGTRAGVRTILVRTGWGTTVATPGSPAGAMRKGCPDAGNPPGGEVIVQPDHIAADLLAAVRWLLKEQKP